MPKLIAQTKRNLGPPRKPAVTRAAAVAIVKPDAKQRKVTPVEVLVGTTKQVAEALQVSERHIFNLMDAGALDYVHIGGARRIPLHAVRSLATAGASLPTTAERNA